MDRPTTPPAQRGDELFAELNRRIVGETVDLGDMTVTLGRDTESGLPALRVQAGDTVFALIEDGGELIELRGNVGPGVED